MLVQFGNNWIQKIPLTAKLDSACGLVQFWLSSEFFSSNWTACSPITYTNFLLLCLPKYQDFIVLHVSQHNRGTFALKMIPLYKYLAQTMETLQQGSCQFYYCRIPKHLAAKSGRYFWVAITCRRLKNICTVTVVSDKADTHHMKLLICGHYYPYTHSRLYIKQNAPNIGICTVGQNYYIAL